MYPLQHPGFQGDSQLQHLKALNQQVERDIYDNNRELRTLNNKISKNDYDLNQMHKLTQQREALLAKQEELRQVLQNQSVLTQEINTQKHNDQVMRHSLGSEYVQIMEDKKRRSAEAKRAEVMAERAVVEANQRQMEEEFQRRKGVVDQHRRDVQEELAERERRREREREEKQREKDEYNRRVAMRNSIEHQKDSVYKQYYQHFMNNQEQLQSIYSNNAAVTDRQKEEMRREVERKEIEEYQQRLARDQEMRVKRINDERDMLRSELQRQMEEKERKKQRERQEELHYQSQVAKYQTNASDVEQWQRQKRKEEQRRYDEDLKQQTRVKSRSMMTGDSGQYSHNPITNPIDFKIGITNPYIIKEYEQTKEKYLGDPQLKLRNLAMVGNKSLVHH